MVLLEQAHDRVVSERVQLDDLYRARLALTNGKGLLVPLGDSKHGALSGATVTAIGAEQPVFTLAGAASFNVMDTPPKKIGIVPYLIPNGTDEWLETPDAGFWTDTAGVSEPSYTWIVYVNVVAGAGSPVIWAKSPSLSATTGTDWALSLNSAEQVLIRVFDDSANARIGLISDSALTSVWHQIVFTKSTIADATAFLYYLDGALTAHTDQTSGVYVEQENGATVVRIGAESDGGNPLNSPITGALFVPGYVMTPNFILRDWHLVNAAMNNKS